MASETLQMSPAELRDWMVTYHFTPESLARVLGVHPVSVRKWANGTYGVKAAGVLALRELAADKEATRARAKSAFCDPAAPEDAMTADDLVAWMTEYAFDVEMLSTTLDVHRVSVTKWRRNKHPIDHITRLALRWLTRDKRALAARQRAQQAVQSARAHERTRVQRAHERAAVATRR